MKTLQIIGGKKTGKTTLMLSFIEAAKARQLKVVALKRAHAAVVMDTPETDSYRFAAAGADLVALSAPGGTLWHAQSDARLEELLRQIPADTDLLLIEGFREEKIGPRLSLLAAFQAQTDDQRLIDLSTPQKRKDWLDHWLA